MTNMYLYHGIPQDMRGTKLIPLNKMFEMNPELHAQYLEKYKGREDMLERVIPLINCKWDDVLQFLPMNPRPLFELQKEVGLISEIPEYKYYRLRLDALDPSQTVVYFKTAPGEKATTVKWLYDVQIGDIQDIPQSTREYYESMVGSNEPVFNYQFVPHIVYKGTVDVSSAKVVNIAQEV